MKLLMTLALLALLASAPQLAVAQTAPVIAKVVPEHARCTAITKKGTRCTRHARLGTAYCAQHTPGYKKPVKTK